MQKKIIAAIIFMSLSTVGFAQNKARKFTFSVNPVSAVHASLNGSLHYKLKDYLAITLPFFFGTDWTKLSSFKTMAVIAHDSYESSLLFGGGGLGARFLLNRNGLVDGFFVEPRIEVSINKFKLSAQQGSLVDSNRISLLPTLLAGYSWYWDNGFYLSTALSAGMGFHLKNEPKVEDGLANRLKEKNSIAKKLYANSARYEFTYGYDISLGYAW
ncbi:MAG: hypothetical protein KC505_09005 [Myxococcales bacterium]|nr:hypothetical protein [Myxococcales bacterium]USN50113.1 MAG: hypothetical protein H6731_07525 [Myxococcales bacterium]